MKQIKSISYVFRVTSQFLSVYTEGFELSVGQDWYAEAKRLNPNPNAIAIHLSYKYNVYADGSHD